MLTFIAKVNARHTCHAHHMQNFTTHLIKVILHFSAYRQSPHFKVGLFTGISGPKHVSCNARRRRQSSSSLVDISDFHFTAPRYPFSAPANGNDIARASNYIDNGLLLKPTALGWDKYKMPKILRHMIG